MSSLIYVHGANGSGKSTLARVLITCAGGIEEELLVGGKAYLSITSPRKKPMRIAKGHSYEYIDAPPMAFIGRYRPATGGSDGIQPYAMVPVAIRTGLNEGYSVFAEGLMTPGVELCKQMDRDCQSVGTRAVFIWLNVPIETCTQNVIARRTRKGNDKPYQNHHLIKKWQSSKNWANNLRAAGLVCLDLNWREARDYCLGYFGLTTAGAVDLLD